MINIPWAAKMDHHLGSEFRQIDGLTQRALHKPHPIFISTRFGLRETSVLVYATLVRILYQAR